MEEVFAICDRATVLRDGRKAGTVAVEASSEADLMHMIVGRQLEELEPHTPAAREDVVLSVNGLSGHVARDVSFDVHRGEIVGLCGLVGMGHDEVPYLLVGGESVAEGEVVVDGVAIASNPKAAQRAGLALLPADRVGRGGVQGASVKENVSLPILGSYFRGGWLDSRREKSDVQAVLSRFGVQPPEPDRPLATLSGGNQQKALLGKWLQVKPKAMILHEPTQGIDVGARLDVISEIRAAAAAGLSVLVVSSEAEDLERLCDRVLVFRDGEVASTLNGSEITKDRITQRCYETSSPVRS
jgi:ribose transport system ATP-binding protein